MKKFLIIILLTIMLISCVPKLSIRLYVDKKEVSVVICKEAPLTQEDLKKLDDFLEFVVNQYNLDLKTEKIYATPMGLIYSYKYQND